MLSSNYSVVDNNALITIKASLCRSEKIFWFYYIRYRFYDDVFLFARCLLRCTLKRKRPIRLVRYGIPFYLFMSNIENGKCHCLCAHIESCLCLVNAREGEWTSDREKEPLFHFACTDRKWFPSNIRRHDIHAFHSFSMTRSSWSRYDTNTFTSYINLHIMVVFVCSRFSSHIRHIFAKLPLLRFQWSAIFELKPLKCRFAGWINSK